MLKEMKLKLCVDLLVCIFHIKEKFMCMSLSSLLSQGSIVILIEYLKINCTSQSKKHFHNHDYHTGP